MCVITRSSVEGLLAFSGIVVVVVVVVVVDFAYSRGTMLALPIVGVSGWFYL
jgi:hypothetical protein